VSDPDYLTLEHLDAVFAEMLLVLRPGAQLLVAFQAGNNERVAGALGDGEAVSLTNYRHAADDVGRCMSNAGLEIHTRAVREAEYAHESTPQAFFSLGRRKTTRVVMVDKSGSSPLHEHITNEVPTALAT
jgi:hypothetical protein